MIANEERNVYVFRKVVNLMIANEKSNVVRKVVNLMITNAKKM